MPGALLPYVPDALPIRKPPLPGWIQYMHTPSRCGTCQVCRWLQGPLLTPWALPALEPDPILSL